jgi:RND family efflux transporter MFP subunit
MSVIKQILLSIVVLVIAGGGWYAWDRNLIPFLPRAAASGPAGQAGGGLVVGPGGQGGPGAFIVGPGGFGFPGGPGGGANSRAPAPIVAAAVTLDDDGFEVKAIGTAAAAKAITIYPQVSGVLSEILFRPGQAVAAGQTLVKLADADQQVAVQKAKITLDAAQAALDRAEQLSRANTITAAALSDARTNFTRAQIDYQTAQLEAGKRTITAPFAGTTGLSGVTVGDLVGSSKAITTLDDVSTVLVAFDVPERASGKVAVGHEVIAATEALPGTAFLGRISAVDSRVDPTARTLRVEATLPNEANVLKPGMAVAISMAFPGEMRPVVPSLSIQYDRNGAYVWKVDNGVVKRVGVDVIDRRSGTVLVVANLQPGDLIAAEGIQRLRENARVNVIDDGSSGAAETPVASVTPEPAATPPAVTGTPAAGNRPPGTAGGPGGNRPQGGAQGAAGATGGPGAATRGPGGTVVRPGTPGAGQGLPPAQQPPAGAAPAATGAQRG